LILKFPYKITIDSSNIVYFTDLLNNLVRRISTTGYVSTIAGVIPNILNGPPNIGALLRPTGMSIDTIGNLWIMELEAFRIRKVGTSRYLSFAAGGSSGSADGQGSNAQMGWNEGSVIGLDGNLYFTDRSWHTIRKLIKATNIVQTILGGPGWLALLTGLVYLLDSTGHMA
jgi:sugar lactone lactonase YvrE